jgi:hypothetical protein
MSDAYDLAGARKAGISDEDSLNHLASVNGYDLAGARAAGISDTDSLNHLMTVNAAPEPVVEKESPEALGGIGATIGAVGAAGDVIYSKGRPLFRMAEKAMGMDSGAPTVKPRTFQDPATVAEQAIARRTATAPDVTGSPSAVKNWAGTQHEGDFLGGAEYKDADRIKKEALAFEKQNPTQKVLPGSLLAVPEEEAKRLAQQRAELAAQQDIAKQAEVQKVAQTRAERLGERAELKGKSNQFGAAKGAGNIAVKVGAPVLGGYQAGSQGAQAYNRLTRPDLTASDVAAGATNVVGATTGALSMVPSKYRIPAAIISQGAGAIANFLDKRNPRKEEVEIEQKAAGGLAGYAEGGGPKLPGKFGKLQKVASGVQKAAHELHGQTPGRMTDWLQHNIGKFVVPTQSDRMGGVGGPSFSANSLVLPQYKGKAWGSGNEGTATAITNLAKDPRFGGPENQIFVPMLGHQNQHKSNQIAFDRLMKDFYEHPEKLTPELREQINAFMRSGGGMEKATGQPFFSPFADFDIADRDTVGLLGRSFDNRGLIAQHGFGGERLGGKKAQIFPYQQRLDEMADPTVAGAPTFAVGPRAFQLTGNVHPEPRPDLNAAFPYLLEGFDLNKAYRPVENSAIFQDFQNQWRLHKGKTEPLKSGKLPEPGYYENTIGYKVNPDDAERIYPRQEITEQLLDSMYKKGHAAGGSINMDELQARKNALPDISLSARDLPNMTGQPGVGYMQTPQGAMARLQMEKELEKARLRAGVSGVAMSIPGMHGVKTMPGQMDVGANIPVGRGNLDISARRSINPIPGRGYDQGINAQYSMKFAEGGEVKHFEGGGKTGALLSLLKPAVNRIDMHFKDVIKRTPQITEAARLLKEGKLSREEFDRIVNQFKPVTPYNFVPQPATEAEAMEALGKKGIGKFKLALPEGHPVDLRLDIPAYKDKGVWVNSIHNAGQKNVIPDTSYSNVAAARDVGFEITPRNQERFLNYAADLEGQNKFTGARMQGLWTPMDDKDFIEKSQDALRSKDWTQIGMDPERHGYFYDRTSMEPIAKADEVLQVGPLVLGKNPKYGKKKDSLYAQGGLVDNYAPGGRIVKGALDALNKASEGKLGQVANKDLTTLQDYHTSLGDRVAAGAKEMQDKIAAAQFKYKKGDRVFTDWTAKNNYPPYEILGTRILGGKFGTILRDPATGKALRDENGKALREAEHVGYQVRHDFTPHGETEPSWRIHTMPETSFKGLIEPEEPYKKGGKVKKK